MTEIKEYTEESFLRYLEYSRTTGIKKDLAYINELRMYERNINNLKTALSKFLLFLNLSDILSLDNIIDNTQDLPQALDYMNKAEIHMKNLPDDLKRHFFFVKGHIYARMEKYKESEEAFVNHFYLNVKNNSILFNNRGEKITKIFEISSMPLYSFRTINDCVKNDLKYDQLSLSDTNKFNDPFDTLLFNYLDYRKNAIKEKSGYDIYPLRDAYKYIKIRCFVKDKIDTKFDTKRAIQNILMWSHYANSHKGICIRYKFNHKEIDKYRAKFKFSNWLEVDYKSDIDLESVESRSLELLFATKKECWNYENEVRLIHFDPECKSEFKQLPLKEIDSKVEAIFFGCKCSAEDKITIKELLEGQNVEFFEFNKKPEVIWSEVYKLEPDDEARFNKLQSDCHFKYLNII